MRYNSINVKKVATQWWYLINWLLSQNFYSSNSIYYILLKYIIMSMSILKILFTVEYVHVTYSYI